MEAIRHTEHYARAWEPGGIRGIMCEHESQEVPHTEHYVRAWAPGGAAYGALCASMRARRCRIRSNMCEHGGQEVPHTEHYVRAWKPGGIRCSMREHESQEVPHTEQYVRAWKPGGADYGALCANMGAKWPVVACGQLSASLSRLAYSGPTQENIDVAYSAKNILK